MLILLTCVPAWLRDVISQRDEVRGGLKICVKHGYMCITPVIVEQVPNGLLTKRASQLHLITNTDQRE